jgi:hypothetical protein
MSWVAPGEAGAETINEPRQLYITRINNREHWRDGEMTADGRMATIFAILGTSRRLFALSSMLRDFDGLECSARHGQILVVGVILLGASSASAQLRPEPDAIRLAPRELIDQLRSDPTDYFRFVNRPWIARVCEVFAEDIRDQPIVRLHGDAHLEQFAVTNDAWGLDDFDDSARGPALIDLVRFLGSIDLTVRQRGWIGHRKALIDRFSRDIEGA